MYKSASILIAALFLFTAISWYFGVRINTTKSIPLGVYITTNIPISVGSYVIFCPPDNSIFSEAKRRGYIGSGFCPGGYGYVMKKVFGTTNDVISVTANGVIINGQSVPLSKPLVTDSANRPMPQFRALQRILSSREVFLMSDITGLSFDARYFGPININQIRSVIYPVITW
jgi:conjugative transfer signal peptidase TraF